MSKKSLFSKQEPSKRTQAIHGEFSSQAWSFNHHLVPPLTASTTFRLESLKRGAQGFIDFGADASKENSENPILIYDRLSEPTTMLLEEQLATLESAECAITFGSGMGAIATSLLAFCKAGQKVVAHRTLYGCTYSLLTNWLPRFAVETILTDINDVANFKKLISEKSTRVIYFESVSNPNLEMIDLEKITSLVKKENRSRTDDQKIIVIVDNTFATPWGLRPIEWGVDCVIQSLTKNISGFGTEMGGAIMTHKKHAPILKMARKDFGAVITPYAAWHILVYGLPTQALRFEKQQENALKIAKFLEGHKKVESVSYPGLKSFSQSRLAKKYLRTPEDKFAPGTMISFVLRGDGKRCEKFVDDIAKNSYSITLAVSLGLNKTLIEVPGYMTHSAYSSESAKTSGIDPRAIRLSVGLESVEDIIADLNKALSRI